MRNYLHRLAYSLPPRDPKEKHRAATSLELLFDLIFVVAIAAAGQQLHHSMIEGHMQHGIMMYFMVFFGLWWPWMNFSWFASAYDNDDAFYRILTFIQIVGALIIASGIPSAFSSNNFDVITVGYFIMRFGLIVQWLRVSLNDPARKKTALRYAMGIITLQVGWILFHFFSQSNFYFLFCVLVVLELLVPVYAESNKMTPWHSGHISERYSLLTIVVLGESIAGCFYAIQDALIKGDINAQIVSMMLGGLLVMFSIWWSYFDFDIAKKLLNRRVAFIWGYGHFFIFISIAAIGASLSAAVDVIYQNAEVTGKVVGFFFVSSLFIYVFTMWLLTGFFQTKGAGKFICFLFIISMFIIPFIFTSAGFCILSISILYLITLLLSKFLVRDYLD